MADNEFFTVRLTARELATLEVALSAKVDEYKQAVWRINQLPPDDPDRDAAKAAAAAYLSKLQRLRRKLREAGQDG